MKKIGIIDIGSNSMRLIIVEIGTGPSFRIYDEVKETVRLGEQLGEAGSLKSERMEKALRTLQVFRDLCTNTGVEEIITAATAAVRNAQNGEEFLQRVQRKLGLKVRVLSGEEEAYLAYWGVVNSLNLQDGLIMDIGGGSTELIWFQERKLKASVSLPMGALTLTSMFELENKVSEKQEKSLREFLLEQYRSVPWLKDLQVSCLIGVGGTFRNLGKIDRNQKNYNLDITHNYRLDASDVHVIYQMVKDKNLSQRKKIAGLSKERADIFVGATAAIATLLDYTQIQHVVVSGNGIREGLIYDYLLLDTASPVDVLDFSINNLMVTYQINRRHSEHVYRLTCALFAKLQELHGITEDLGRVLKTASMLHDCGIRIRYYNHHEHSFYMILHSGINGLTHRELLMSAFIAASHRKDPVHVSAPKYSFLLSKEDIGIIEKVGVLLRLAESLDRGMTGIVRDVQCDVRGDQVVILTQAEETPELAIYDAQDAEKQFKKVYKRELVIR